MADSCKHCGSPVPAHQAGSAFCCNGCEFVYTLIHEEGLDTFYRFREGAIAPVNPAALRLRDFDWLADAVQEAEQAESTKTEQSRRRGGYPELAFGISGISCVGCVWLIERVARDAPGIRDVSLNPQRGELNLSWSPGELDGVSMAQSLQRFGYLLHPEGEVSVTSTAVSGLGRRIGLCGAFALNAMLFTVPRYFGMEDDFPLAGLMDLLTMVFATLSFIVGGSYFFEKAWRGLRHRVLHIDFPISLGLIAAYLGSVAGSFWGESGLLYFDFVATFSFLMLCGRWLQEFTIERNKARVQKANARPRTAFRLDEATGERKEIPLEAIAIGDLLEAPPSAVIPVASRLEADEASISLEWINGESAPVAWQKNRLLPSGAFNIGVEPLICRATERWEHSLLARLLAPTQSAFRNALLENVLKAYTAIIILIALGGGVYWLTTGSLSAAAQVFISVLVISCPCALGVAYPLANELAVARLRQRGAFSQSDALWAQLKQIRTIVFDKTGTLTLEAPRLTNPEVLNSLSHEDLAVLAQIVDTSMHPISRSLREALLTVKSPHPLPGFLEKPGETIGYGLTFTHSGKFYSLGRPGWNPFQISNNTGTGPSQGAQCEYRINGLVVASFSFLESVRHDAKAQIAALKQSGYAVALLSGDRQEKVTELAAQLGIESAQALGDLSPEAKATWIEQNAPEDAMMVGDGANDSLAFDAAVCRATPAIDRGLLESKADFYFLGQGVEPIVSAFAVARARARAVHSIFAFAVAYNLGAIAVCLAGKMSPLWAAILMPLSSLVTIGLVLLAFRQKT